MKNWIKDHEKSVYIDLAILVFVLFFAISVGYCDVNNRTYNVVNYSAMGIGETDDAKSIQAAINIWWRKILLLIKH